MSGRKKEKSNKKLEPSIEREPKGEVISFRVWPPYLDIIKEKASARRASKNEFSRHATLQAVDSGILDIPETLKLLRDDVGVLTEQLIQVRQLLAEIDRRRN